jgi:hypothetical protein
VGTGRPRDSQADGAPKCARGGLGFGRGPLFFASFGRRSHASQTPGVRGQSPLRGHASSALRLSLNFRARGALGKREPSQTYIPSHPFEYLLIGSLI